MFIIFLLIYWSTCMWSRSATSYRWSTAGRMCWCTYLHMYHIYIYINVYIPINMHISIDICAGRPGGRQAAVEVQPDVCAGTQMYTYIIYIHTSMCIYILRVDLNPSKKKSTRFYVGNVRIDFRTLFLNWYKIPLWFVFRTCFASAISVRPRRTCESSRRSARR